MSAHRYVEEHSSAAMPVTKRSVGVTPEANLRECITHIYVPLPSVNKVAHSGFETLRSHHQKSRTWVSVAAQKGLMSSNFFLKMYGMKILFYP